MKVFFVCIVIVFCVLNSISAHAESSGLPTLSYITPKSNPISDEFLLERLHENEVDSLDLNGLKRYVKYLNYEVVENRRVIRELEKTMDKKVDGALLVPYLMLTFTERSEIEKELLEMSEKYATKVGVDDLKYFCGSRKDHENLVKMVKTDYSDNRAITELVTNRYDKLLKLAKSLPDHTAVQTLLDLCSAPSASSPSPSASSPSPSSP